MKKRGLGLMILLGISVALGLTALVSQRAAAQCPGTGILSMPCPKGETEKKKRATATPLPTRTATPTATLDAAQVALLCGNMPATGGGVGANLTGPVTSQNPVPPSQSPSPAAPNPGPVASGFTILELGGAGLVGLLIGLLVPAVQGRLGGAGGLNRAGFGNTNDMMWKKFDPEGKLDAFGKDQTYNKVGTFSKIETAGKLDAFGKDQTYNKVGTFSKIETESHLRGQSALKSAKFDAESKIEGQTGLKTTKFDPESKIEGETGLKTAKFDPGSKIETPGEEDFNQFNKGSDAGFGDAAGHK